MKKRLSFLAIVMCLILFTGCLSGFGKRTIQTTKPFDEAQAAALLAPGPNTIRVNAFMRQMGGGTVSCAGFTVNLVPATALAEERIIATYGSAQGGMLNIDQARRIDPNIAGTDPRYINMQKEIPCNSEGYAIFNNVADGEFYVVAKVAWIVPRVGLAPQENGGVMCKKVSVRGGQIVDVVLSNIN